jgi:hypothetical protein
MMIRYALFLCLAQLALTWPGSAEAQPDFNNARKAGDITFFQDIKQTAVFYYLPGSLAIGRSAEKKPDLSFILMRYAGSATFNDEGQKHFRNILTIRLLMKPIDADSLRKARQLLQQSFPSVQLRPLPISQVEAMIVFTPVGAPDTARLSQKGEMAAEDDAGYTTSATYWQERYFTLCLDNNSANLLLQAFNKNLTVISFMYAFYSKGRTTKSALDISGYGSLDNTLKQQLKAAAADSTAADSLHECIVKSDAFPINIDTAENPDLIRKIDMNDVTPPGYAVVNVRNYDFANHLRSDLYEKTVDLEATGAGGDPVNLSVSFNRKNTDVTSVNFRFKYAVRLDRPYRYRVRELLTDGQETISGWNTVDVWSGLLDVTTRPPTDTQ